MNYIINKLYEKDYEAYAVGGCVRDSILGKNPQDWDITTSASPDIVMEIFKSRAIPTGLKHGTVTVLVGDESFEVTTFRIDGEYFDGRRPETVSFTQDIKEDLSRRDFTINAMAYNDKTGLVDFFGGLEDLQNKLIRCVGNAQERFDEDYLRMLRAYRFSAVLQFELEASLVESCMMNKKKLISISAERIRTEIDKLLTGGDWQYIKRFFDDFSDVLMPEVNALKGIGQNNKYHYLDVYDHTFEVLKNTPPAVDMRLTALFHDTGKALTKTTDALGIDHFHGHQKKSADIAFDIMKRLKYDNKTINDVVALVRTHDDRMKPEKKNIRKLICRLGVEKAYKNLQIQYADIMGQSRFSQEENLPILKECFRLFDEVVVKNEACSIKQLAITGMDIMNEFNIRPGEKVGEILNSLLEAVLDDPEMNTKEVLIKTAKLIYKNE